MSEFHPSAPLRAYTGSVERPKPILELRPGTWESKVTITPLQLRGRGGTVFEVRAEWHGPPHPDAPGPPPAPGVKSRVADSWQTEDQELARGVALRAGELLGVGSRPDLRAIALDFQRRENPSLTPAWRLREQASNGA